MRWRAAVPVAVAACLAATGAITALAMPGAGAAAAAVRHGGALASDHRAVRYAEAVGAAPDFIFPFVTLGYYSQANIQQFQYLMYRPLYWFGGAGSVALDERLSLAALPAFSDHDRVVTVHLKRYRWSNGRRVDARDVLFWLNILHANRRRYAGWFPGGLSMPTSVRTVRLKSPTEVVITLRHRVNPTWFTYNELSEVTPLPLAWTRTSLADSPGSGGCAVAAYGTADAACRAVYDFLSTQSGHDPARPTEKIDELGTYGTSPLWSVVDGPWRLQSYAATHPAVFVPNRRYSGPNKPRIAELVEVPFDSEAQELHALVDGSIEVGYLPTGDFPARTSTPLVAGRNVPALAARYQVDPVYPWEIRYTTLNFHSTGDTGHAGAIFRQLYVRQAMQLLVDQRAIVATVARGYGAVGDGPVPLLPRTSFVSAVERKDPYRYDPSRAERLLHTHGWSVVPDGIDVCERPGTAPGECGRGIPAGSKLDFGMLTYPTAQTHALAVSEATSWSRAGIHVTVSTETFDPVITPSQGCPNGCRWELTSTHGDWEYLPDIYPSGEEVFSTTPVGGANNGLFVTARNTKMIAETDTTQVSLGRWESYVARQLPFVFEPELVGQFTEIDKALHAAPPGPLGEITPATWWWKH